MGDIHGHYDLYRQGVRELGAEDSVIISVGDVIDRGPKNLKCLEEFTKKPNRYMVLGNHEDMMLKSRTDRDQAMMWLMNGGLETLSEVGDDGITCMLEMLSDTPSILEVHHRGKLFGVVHGGIPLGSPSSWEDIVLTAKNPAYLNSLVWDRSVIDKAKSLQKMNHSLCSIPTIKDVDYVLHGHTPTKEPTLVGNRLYQDVGSFFSNRLCFSWFDGNKIDYWTTEINKGL